MGSCKKSCYL